MFDRVSGLVERRFVLNALFPSLAFWGALFAVFLVERGDPAAAIRAWGEQPTTLQLLETVGAVAWLLFFAALLSATVTTIVRLYEGYWSFPLGFQMAQQGRRWHQLRLRQLDVLKASRPDALEQIYLSYPPSTRPEEVMPTRLGNILKNAELYPLLRYGIPSAALVWPRLYNLFPPGYLQLLADARSGLDFMATVSILAGIFALVSAAYLIVVAADWWLFLLCLLGGFGLAWAAYEGAVTNAYLYAEQVKVAFDLYRTQLLKQLRLPLPATLDEEAETWRRLATWIYRADRPDVQFTHDGGDVGASAHG